MSPHWQLFDGRYASRLLHAQWAERSDGAGIPHNMPCVDGDGRKTADFDALYRSTFPTREQLPDVIATPEGKPTLRFIEVFR